MNLLDIFRIVPALLTGRGQYQTEDSWEIGKTRDYHSVYEASPNLR
jgi:hypothetical protein